MTFKPHFIPSSPSLPPAAGLGSIDHDLFAQAFTTLGPLAASYKLPSRGDEKDILDGLNNDNKELARASLYNNNKVFENMQFIVSLAIAAISFALLIIAVKKIIVTRYFTRKMYGGLGEYEHLYVDVNLTNSQPFANGKDSKGRTYRSMETEEHFVQNDNIL